MLRSKGLGEVRPYQEIRRRLMLSVDSALIRVVLTELVANSIKYGEPDMKFIRPFVLYESYSSRNLSSRLLTSSLL